MSPIGLRPGLRHADDSISISDRAQLLLLQLLQPCDLLCDLGLGRLHDLLEFLDFLAAALLFQTRQLALLVSDRRLVSFDDPLQLIALRALAIDQPSGLCLSRRSPKMLIRRRCKPYL